MAPSCPVILDLSIVSFKIKHKPEITTFIIKKDTDNDQSKGKLWKSDKLFHLITRLISLQGNQKKARQQQMQKL